MGRYAGRGLPGCHLAGRVEQAGVTATRVLARGTGRLMGFSGDQCPPPVTENMVNMCRHAR